MGGKSHGGWENGCGVWGCLITPSAPITPRVLITPSALSALITPITKAHTDPTRFNKNNLW